MWRVRGGPVPLSRVLTRQGRQNLLCSAAVLGPCPLYPVEGAAISTDICDCFSGDVSEYEC